MRLAILTILLLSPGQLISQLPIPSIPCIIQSIEENNAQMLEDNISEFQVQQPPRWLNYVPNIGMSSILVNSSIRFAPTVSISINQFISDKRNQYANEAKIKSLSKKEVSQTKYEINRAILAREDIINKKGMLSNMVQILHLKEKIFKYDSMKFVNKELTPDSYYRSKISILQEKQALEQQKNLIYELTIKLYEKAYLEPSNPCQE